LTEQKEYPELARFGRYLRAKTYLLGTPLELKKFFKPAFQFPQKPEDIIEPVSKQLLLSEVNSLPSNSLLFKQSNFNVYCAEASLLPNVLCEIGRLREITFREVGEGTNCKIDIDEYDLYYNHLFIWDDLTNSIAGAYRIGMGSEIMHSYGIKGFYLRSLFKMKKGCIPILNESLELGRSFIPKEYQRTPLPLFMLWKGILHFLVRNPDYRYLIGPVSISNSFTNMSKSMIVSFIMKNHFDHQMADLVKPKKKFIPRFNDGVDFLIENAKTLKDVDFVIKDVEDKNRIPILLKKYIELNGKIICFNIDPKFNDALDGLLVLDLMKVPEDTIRMLSKEMDSRLMKSRFKFLEQEPVEYYEFDSVPQF